MVTENYCIPEKIDRLFFTLGKNNIYQEVIGDTEKLLIEKALERSFGNQSLASRILGITRNTLRVKIKKLDISCKKYKA